MLARSSLALILLLLGASSRALALSNDPHIVFALERAAVGGSAWNAVAAIRTSGTQISGGAPGAFVQLVDRRTGFWRATVDSGPLRDVSGFDGTSWDAHNGIVAQADLPGIVADAVTAAYMARDGWWNWNDRATMRFAGRRAVKGAAADVVHVVPHGGSPIDVWIDRRSHLIVHTVQYTDAGALMADYTDFRLVQGVRLPFRTVTVDAAKARTETIVKSASTMRAVPTAELKRPASDPRGSFGGAPPAIVPFQFGSIDTGHILVDAAFAGKPLKMIFDSGGANLIVPDAARRVGLKPGGGMDLNGVGNASQAASFANVSEIELGSSRLRDQNTIVTPLPYVLRHLRAGITIDGLLGFETLAAFRVTIDYAAKTLTIARFDAPPPRGTTVHFFSEGSHAYVPVTIDGVTGLFGLDTGDSGGLTVFRSFARAHGIFATPGLQYVSTGGVGGALSFSLYRGSSMTIAGTKLAAPVVSVTDAAAGAFASHTIAGNIGARVLDRFRVTFDFRARTVTFLANESVDDRFDADRTGFSLTQRDPDAFTVLSVVANSPASAADIRPGDRIITFDGKSVAREHLGLGDLRPVLKDRTSDLPLVIRRGKAEVPTILKPRELL